MALASPHSNFAPKRKSFGSIRLQGNHTVRQRRLERNRVPRQFGVQAHSGILQQLLNRNSPAKLPGNVFPQHSSDIGGAAETKEVIIQADVIPLEQLRPHCKDLLLMYLTFYGPGQPLDSWRLIDLAQREVHPKRLPNASKKLHSQEGMPPRQEIVIFYFDRGVFEQRSHGGEQFLLDRRQVSSSRCLSQ